jgi:hypothetical protein
MYLFVRDLLNLIFLSFWILKLQLEAFSFDFSIDFFIIRERELVGAVLIDFEFFINLTQLQKTACLLMVLLEHDL